MRRSQETATEECNIKGYFIKDKLPGKRVASGLKHTKYMLLAGENFITINSNGK